MRILQLTPRIAWPPTDGGRVAMWQITRALHEAGASVDVLSLNPRRRASEVTAARDAFAPVKLQAVDIDTSRYGAAMLRSVRRDIPALVARFYSRAFEAVLRERLRPDRYDVVQIESPFLLPYLAAIREESSAVVSLRSLNVEFRIWERLANGASGLRRLAFQDIARSLRRFEIAQLNAVDALIPITGIDADDYRTLGCTRPIHVLPAAVEARSAARTATTVRRIGFIGSLDYRPNQEAVQWIVSELAPRLDEFEIHLAGSRAPQWLRDRMASSRIVFRGEVPDANAFLDELDVVVVPIFSGGGMRIKILDAMACGRVVVSTTIGAEGIDAKNGCDLLLADRADDFVAAIRSLAADRKRLVEIGESARRFVSRHHAPLPLAGDLLRFYEQLSQRRAVERGL